MLTPSRYFLTMTGIIIFSQTSAQKQITHQQMYWIRYYGEYILSPKWTSTIEVEDRRFLPTNRQLYWVLPRVNFLYKLGSGWETAAGFMYYLTSNPADPDKPVQVTVPELRPHEEIDYQQKINKLTISHRYRLEERFIHNSSNTSLTPGYTFNFRFRYQLQLAYAIIKKASGAGSMNVRVYDEIMFNFGHSIINNSFDQNRIYAGINYGISKTVQAELGYLNWFQERSSSNQYYDRDIARLTIYHNIDFIKNKLPDKIQR
jgi:Protein of unknown function (DUF2490)